jgi:hypothetical protein
MFEHHHHDHVFLPHVFITIGTMRHLAAIFDARATHHSAPQKLMAPTTVSVLAAFVWHVAQLAHTCASTTQGAHASRLLRIARCEATGGVACDTCRCLCEDVSCAGVDCVCYTNGQQIHRGWSIQYFQRYDMVHVHERTFAGPCPPAYVIVIVILVDRTLGEHNHRR